MLLLMASSLTAFVPTPGAFTVDVRPPGVHPTEARRQQQRIAEITELIHVASLLHDDVIDDAETRRGLKALNLLFAKKFPIRAGNPPPPPPTPFPPPDPAGGEGPQLGVWETKSPSWQV